MNEVQSCAQWLAALSEHPCCSYSRMPKHDAGTMAPTGYARFRAAFGATQLPQPHAAVGHTARPRFQPNCAAMLLVRREQYVWAWSCLRPRAPIMAPPWP